VLLDWYTSVLGMVHYYSWNGILSLLDWYTRVLVLVD
jgi:hypothetical protein